MDCYVSEINNAHHEYITALSENPFLTRCRNGLITIDELKFFLVQQGIYSSNFIRYLCALMSNLASNEDVRDLADNLFEELGLEGGHAGVPHHVMYRRMLDRFGLSIEAAQPTEATRTLIAQMLNHCRNPNPAWGLGAICLGAEALVPAVYSDILAGFAGCGVDEDQLDFFRIHIDCDDGHAETLRTIMVRTAILDPGQLPIMLQAGRDLVEARFDFFSSLQDRTAAPAFREATEA